MILIYVLHKTIPGIERWSHKRIDCRRPVVAIRVDDQGANRGAIRVDWTVVSTRGHHYYASCSRNFNHLAIVVDVKITGDWQNGRCHYHGAI